MVPWGLLALQKNISTRRNAQKLAKNGQLEKAINAYRPLLESGDVDPYDHLYVGDLHVKLGHTDQAITHYESAIHEYSKLGFHRNGIALCRKILRLNPGYRTVYRHLGDLYAAEELLGDAMDAYFNFLEGLPPEERDGDELRDVLGRAEILAPKNPELALRLSKYLEDLDRIDHAAEVLLRAAAHARASDATQLAAELKAKADALDPDAAGRMEASDLAEKRMEPVAAAPAAPEKIPVEVPPAPEEAVQGEQDDAEGPKDPVSFGEIDLDAEPAPQPPAPAPPEDEVDLTIELESAVIPSESPETAAQPNDGAPDDPSAELEIEPTAAALPKASAEEVVLELPETESEEIVIEAPAGNLADPETATRLAIASEQWTSARKRAEEWIHQDPASMEAVDKLIEICEALEDNAGIVRGLSLKGDLFIREGELESAVPIFRRVLGIEPGNTTALRRMQRFQQLGLKGSALAAEPGPIEAVLEANDAVVAVREDAAGDADGDKDWLEIGALLDEFREGLKAQVGDDDPQAHYDLGLSHYDMELFEDAVNQFDEALACEGLSTELELRIRELRGKSLSKLRRSTEAIEEFECALAVSGVSPAQEAGLRCLIGMEHQVLGDLDAAKASLKKALEINPKLTGASELLAALEGNAA